MPTVVLNCILHRCRKTLAFFPFIFALDPPFSTARLALFARKFILCWLLVFPPGALVLDKPFLIASLIQGVLKLEAVIECLLALEHLILTMEEAKGELQVKVKEVVKLIEAIIKGLFKELIILF